MQSESYVTTLMGILENLYPFQKTRNMQKMF